MASESVEILGPVVQSTRAKPLNGPALAVLFDHPSRGVYILLRSRTYEGERRWTK
jgi:hypothetical protein